MEDGSDFFPYPLPSLISIIVYWVKNQRDVERKERR